MRVGVAVCEWLWLSAGAEGWWSMQLTRRFGPNRIAFRLELELELELDMEGPIEKVRGQIRYREW